MASKFIERLQKQIQFIEENATVKDGKTIKEKKDEL